MIIPFCFFTGSRSSRSVRTLTISTLMPVAFIFIRATLTNTRPSGRLSSIISPPSRECLITTRLPFFSFVSSIRCQSVETATCDPCASTILCHTLLHPGCHPECHVAGVAVCYLTLLSSLPAAARLRRPMPWHGISLQRTARLSESSWD